MKFSRNQATGLAASAALALALLTSTAANATEPGTTNPDNTGCTGDICAGATLGRIDMFGGNLHDAIAGAVAEGKGSTDTWTKADNTSTAHFEQNATGSDGTCVEECDRVQLDYLARLTNTTSTEGHAESTGAEDDDGVNVSFSGVSGGAVQQSTFQGLTQILRGAPSN